MEQGNILAQLLPLVVLFAIFYFLIIRPQQQQQKKHKAMLESLKKGDKIVTSGGLRAEIIKVEEDFLKISLDDNTFAKLEKEFISKKIDDEN
jgi:preprotein translocase subunit YajC